MNRVAVVTGGTRGIGGAISVALKKSGYKVAAVYAGNDAAALLVCFIQQRPEHDERHHHLPAVVIDAHRHELEQHGTRDRADQAGDAGHFLIEQPHGKACDQQQRAEQRQQRHGDQCDRLCSSGAHQRAC